MGLLRNSFCHKAAENKFSAGLAKKREIKKFKKTVAPLCFSVNQ